MFLATIRCWVWQTALMWIVKSEDHFFKRSFLKTWQLSPLLEPDETEVSLIKIWSWASASQEHLHGYSTALSLIIISSFILLNNPCLTNKVLFRRVILI